MKGTIMSDIDEENAPFYEFQKFRQWWLWLLFGLPTVLVWWTFIVQIIGGKPFGQNPAPDLVVWILLAIFGIAMPVIFWFFGMKTVVRDDKIIVGFPPFHRRVIMLADLKSHKACEYHPIWDFGGYGIRWKAGWGMAYNVSGKHGVEIELNNGKHIMIGSQRAEELETAIKYACQQGRFH
jgi:hypothetical protein